MVLTSHNKPEVPSLEVDVTCQVIVYTTTDPLFFSVSRELDKFYPPAWIEKSLHSDDCLDMFFPPDKAILETLNGWDNIFEYFYHKSHLFPELSRIENQEFNMRLAEDVVSTNIFPNPDVVETMHIDANSLLE